MERYDYQQQLSQQEQQEMELKLMQQELAWQELERRYAAATNLIQGDE